MAELHAKKGNPIITGEDAENENIFKILYDYAEIKRLGNLILDVDKVIIVYDSRRKSYKYTKDVSLEWVIEKIETFITKVKTDQLRDLANKHGLL